MMVFEVFESNEFSIITVNNFRAKIFLPSGQNVLSMKYDFILRTAVKKHFAI